MSTLYTLFNQDVKQYFFLCGSNRVRHMKAGILEIHFLLPSPTPVKRDYETDDLEVPRLMKRGQAQ